jgi:hypothetical protein
MASFRVSCSVVIAMKGKGEGKVFPVHTTKAYGWSKDTAPLILNLGP